MTEKSFYRQCCVFTVAIGLSFAVFAQTESAAAPSHSAAVEPVFSAPTDVPLPPAPLLSVPQPQVTSEPLQPQTSAASRAAGLSRDAQRTYEATRDKLVQIRTLLRATDTQSSIGSGFFVAKEGLIMTNFHVASQLALEPERYRGVYVAVSGAEGEVELLAFDVRNDLALLRVKSAVSLPVSEATPVSSDATVITQEVAQISQDQQAQQDPATLAMASQPMPQAQVVAHGVLQFREPSQPLAAGERIYSMGNPLDIGFAVTEGTYNGLVQRSFYPRIFFGGALNPGMSGGPALDDLGRVVGVNVSKRLDGDLLSFLIPAEFAINLLQRAATAEPITKPAHAEVAKQLLAHQEVLVQRFTQTPFKLQNHGAYRVPVLADALARCWGQERPARETSYDLDSTDCQMDSHLFVDQFNTGFVRLRYESYATTRLDPLRFSVLYSSSFKNESLMQRSNRHLSGVECSERFIESGGMPMRAVVCMNAYRKFSEIYDLVVLLATVNQPQRGILARLDVRGLSFENGLKVAEHYLAGFKWEAAP